MKFPARTGALLIAALCAAVPRLSAQSGSVEFVARATPSGGLEEPVRGFPFFLLTKSFEEITKEVDASSPRPDMNAFIDKLNASSQLKTWMKKNQWIKLSGEDFIQKVAPADIINVPEFYSAYLERSAGASALDFPKAKYKPSDKTKDPAKYERLSKEYHQAVEHYIETNPQSKDGMDLELVETDPSSKWQAAVDKRKPEIRRQVRDLAQTKYFVSRSETNLQGQGFLNGIPAGTYWLTTLDVTADVGDARPRWDVPVSVRPGETAYVVLSNVNAIASSRPSD